MQAASKVQAKCKQSADAPDVTELEAAPRCRSVDGFHLLVQGTRATRQPAEPTEDGVPSALPTSGQSLAHLASQADPYTFCVGLLCTEVTERLQLLDGQAT